MKIFNNITELIGRTPLLETKSIEKKYNLKAKLIVKIEGLNPAGSTKERVALQMINDAENEGKLVKGSTIIEPTSGNTGIGLTIVGVQRGYRVIIVMPDSMSIERRNLIKAYGAELVLTEGSKGMKGAIAKANELAKEIPNSFIPSQFDNMSNPKAHYLTTGPEIYRDLDGQVDAFVSAVGTGGTISGTGKYLKEQNPHTQVIAVEPKDSPVLTKGVAGPHKIQGIGAGFVPNTLDTSIYNEVIPVSNEDAYKYAREASIEGLFIGISSGAALCAAIEVASRKENENKNIVVLFPDSGERYLSTPGFID
jgi:cysteine synthase A